MECELTKINEYTSSFCATYIANIALRRGGFGSNTMENIFKHHEKTETHEAGSQKST